MRQNVFTYSPRIVQFDDWPIAKAALAAISNERGRQMLLDMRSAVASLPMFVPCRSCGATAFEGLMIHGRWFQRCAVCGLDLLSPDEIEVS
jgi:hypothetical protein